MGSKKRVLQLLTKKKNGITFHNFKTGFRLGARIKELRDAGHNIVTVREPMKSGWYARYVLMGE